MKEGSDWNFLDKHHSVFLLDDVIQLERTYMTSYWITHFSMTNWLFLLCLVFGFLLLRSSTSLCSALNPAKLLTWRTVFLIPLNWQEAMVPLISVAVVSISW